MKWMAVKYDRNEIYHLPQEQCYATQDTHYLSTACRKEVKAFYGHWLITENPPPEKVCQKCLATIT